jgi:hypothetical protein
MTADHLPPARRRPNRHLQIAAAVAGLLGVGVAGRVATSAPAGAGAAQHRLTADVVAPAAPAIDGKTSYAPHQLVRLKADGVQAGAAVRWRVSPRAGVDRATTKPEVLEFAAPPGTYEVELLVIRQTPAGLDLQEQYERVTIGEPKTQPPPPAPNPGNGKLDPVQALGRIQFGGSSCTATVIGPRRPDGRWDVLTASHCVSGVGARGTLFTKDGKALAVRVAVHQTRPDLAWLVTADMIENLAYAELAAELPPVGTKMFHQGFGIDVPGNREDGTVLTSEDGNGQTKFRLSVSPGDSGGGMLRSDNLEVISTVCCTSRLAGTGDVWGASVRSIRAARPGAVKLDALPTPADDGGPGGPCGSFADAIRRLLAL